MWDKDHDDKESVIEASMGMTDEDSLSTSKVHPELLLFQSFRDTRHEAYDAVQEAHAHETLSTSL